jgi:hypothetical protein
MGLAGRGTPCVLARGLQTALTPAAHEGGEVHLQWGQHKDPLQAQQEVFVKGTAKRVSQAC